MIGLVVMGSFHFARAAILTHIAGFGKNVVPFFGLWMGQSLLLIGSGLVQGLRKNRGLKFGREFWGVIAHKAVVLENWLFLLGKIIRSRCGN